MTWFKRIGSFLAVNVLVMVTISLILNVLGVKPYLTPYGLDYQSLMIFCLVWGMGGAFISLAPSRVMEKWMMGVKVISPDTRDPDQRELLQMVHVLARAAHLSAMPQVGIYESHEVNAFATGPTKSRSLVAVSSGLLQCMKQAEVNGVLAHEVAHIANGDMVTMTLIQGVVNAFVMFLARVIAFAFTMAGREHMIQALESLKKTFENVDSTAQPAIAALKISSRPGGIMRLFSTHPPLDVRFERLKRAI